MLLNWNWSCTRSISSWVLVLSKPLKVKPWSQDWLIAAGAYPGFCSIKRLEVILLPLDGMVVHRRSLPRNLLGFPQQLSFPQPGLEPEPLAPESSALTMRPRRLPRQWCSGLKSMSYIYTSNATLSSGIAWNNPRLACCFFSLYTLVITGERIYQVNKWYIPCY